MNERHQFEATFTVWPHEKRPDGLVPVMDAECQCVCLAQPFTAQALCELLNAVAHGRVMFEWDNGEPLKGLQTINPVLQ